MKARREPFEALRGDGPVAVAAGALEMVEMALEAVAKGRAQLGAQRRIFSRRGCERRVE